jgi:hypothetical protein
MVKILSLGVMSLLLVISLASVSYAEWSHGIGTGIFMLNIEGDIGVNTTLAGPVMVEDVDLDFDDISDLLETAIGFGGYSTDGKWMIRYAYASMELEGEKSNTFPANAVLAAGHTVSAELNFEATSAEVTVGYEVYQNPSISISVDGGLRYMKHEISAGLGISGPVLNRSISRDIDEDWTDVLIGGTVTVPFTEKWIWNTSANAGLEGSEGTYMGQTGITWKFYKRLSSTFYGKYTAVEFENESRGESNWYLYDVDEFGLGLNFVYNC